MTIMATAQQINEPFTFPVKPGTKEWSVLKTERDRFKVMQIPDELLSNLTTHALVGTCLNFPAFGYINAYDNIQTGYMVLSSKFNGLTELSKRKDSWKSLNEFYQIAGVKGFDTEQINLDQQFWSIKLTWIELLMAQYYVIESMEKNNKTSLLSVAQEKLKMKQVNVDFGNSILSTTFLIGRVLHTLNLPDFESEYTQNVALRDFLVTSKLTDKTVIDKLIEFNQKYLNAN
jgi:hypothetical protein